MKSSIIIVFLFLSYFSYSQNFFYSKIDSVQSSKIENAKKDGIPLFFLKVDITHDAIGTPEVNVIAKNISDMDIDAFDIQISCYNKYDEPVNHYLNATNIFTGTSDELLKAGETVRTHYTWTLYGFDNTAKVKVYLKRCHFVNGKTYVVKDKKKTMVEGLPFR